MRATLSTAGWERSSMRETRRGQPRGNTPRSAEGEGDRHRAQTNARRADEEPEVAAEGVIEPAAGQRTQGHAERGHEGHGAEGGTHDAGPEVLADQDGVERHHATVGKAEERREGVEGAQLAREEIQAHCESLQEETGDQ